MSETLVPVEVLSGVVTPAASLNDIAQAQADYQALCDRLLTDDDYQIIKERGVEKRFKTKSAWRKLAVAFNVNTDIRVEDIREDERSHTYKARYVVRATAPNGRHADGVGVCAVWERCCDPAVCKIPLKWEDSGNFRHAHCLPTCDGRHAFTKPDHDVVATAATRATNRACADLFGLGEVSAEEADTGPGRGGGPPRASTETGEVITAEQQDEITKIVLSLRYTEEQAKTVFEDAIGRKTSGWADLTKTDAQKILEVLRKAQQKKEAQGAYTGAEEPF